MATILLIGPQDPLLEGLAQSIAGVGHMPQVAHELHDATELASSEAPLVIVIQREIAAANLTVARLPLEPGGALILYRRTGDSLAPLAPVLQRLALADLELPLERHRLLTLILRVDERARLRGHGGRSEPPEQRAT
jgi:hypothetical protein